jgi:NADH:ubiquinone oxidoreductase subunit 3 (subunit A)
MAELLFVAVDVAVMLVLLQGLAGNGIGLRGLLEQVAVV